MQSVYAPFQKSHVFYDCDHFVTERERERESESVRERKKERVRERPWKMLMKPMMMMMARATNLDVVMTTCSLVTHFTLRLFTITSRPKTQQKQER